MQTPSLAGGVATAREPGTVLKPRTESLELCAHVATTKCHPTWSVAALSAARLLLSPSWRWVSYYPCYSEAQIGWEEENGV